MQDKAKTPAFGVERLLALRNWTDKLSIFENSVL